MKTINMKILICALLLALVIECHCRSIIDVDIDDIEFPSKLKGYEDEIFGKNKAEDQEESKEEEEEKLVPTSVTTTEPVKNKTVSIHVYLSYQLVQLPRYSIPLSLSTKVTSITNIANISPLSHVI